MDVRTGLLILVSVTLSATAQVSLRFGMTRPRVVAALADGDHWISAASIATTPAVVGGLALYLLGAILWLLVLAQIDVTKAYPFVGVGFLITMALGFLFLGEIVSSARLVGTVLVATGVVLVARS